MGVAAILAVWPRLFEQSFIPLKPEHMDFGVKRSSGFVGKDDWNCWIWNDKMMTLTSGAQTSSRTFFCLYNLAFKSNS